MKSKRRCEESIEGIDMRSKSYVFAVRIVRLSQFLTTEHHEYVLSKQVLRSGTAIGALIHEAEFGQSKPDFRSKMSIALKEANETHYWLTLLNETDYTTKCLKVYRMIV